jgi:hypothetical protein
MEISGRTAPYPASQGFAIYEKSFNRLRAPPLSFHRLQSDGAQ